MSKQTEKADKPRDTKAAPAVVSVPLRAREANSPVITYPELGSWASRGFLLDAAAYAIFKKASDRYNTVYNATGQKEEARVAAQGIVDAMRTGGEFTGRVTRSDTWIVVAKAVFGTTKRPEQEREYAALTDEQRITFEERVDAMESILVDVEL